MVGAEKILEMTDELLEQIVLNFYPDRDIYQDTKDGDLLVKGKYSDMRVRIYKILDSNLNEDKK